jgi:hypothetical protein
MEFRIPPYPSHLDAERFKQYFVILLMSFQIADVKALLLAGLICGQIPAAMAQSSGGGQHILFSSPDGQITSNAPLPMAQAPEPQELPNTPDASANIHQFSASMPAAEPIFSPPPPILQENAGTRDDFQDPMNVRTEMSALTPAKIMSVPTPEQIFGLAEKPEDAQKKSGQFNNGNTNAPDFNTTTTLFTEPTWAKPWSGDTTANDTGNSTGSSNTTQKTSSGFFSGLFDSGRIDNVLGHHSSSSDSDTIFPSSQSSAAPQQSSSWLSALSSDTLTPSTPASGSGFNNFTAPAAEPSSPFGSQSPFATPQVSHMDTLPQVPTLPSLPGQNTPFGQPQPAASTTPSWGPKPPPWTQAQTPWGTPVH